MDGLVLAVLVYLSDSHPCSPTSSVWCMYQLGQVTVLPASTPATEQPMLMNKCKNSHCPPPFADQSSGVNALAQSWSA
jgi:hypothetical protein